VFMMNSGNSLSADSAAMSQQLPILPWATSFGSILSNSTTPLSDSFEARIHWTFKLGLFCVKGSPMLELFGLNWESVYLSISWLVSSFSSMNSTMRILKSSWEFGKLLNFLMKEAPIFFPICHEWVSMWYYNYNLFSWL